LKQSMFDDDEDDDDDDEEEDDFIDTESLGDWRTVRRNLALEQEDGDESPKTKTPKSVSKENEEILLEQNEDLAEEYITGVWAHEVATVSAVVAFLLVIPVVERPCSQCSITSLLFLLL
jgi:hypothetical protein